MGDGLKRERSRRPETAVEWRGNSGSRGWLFERGVGSSGIARRPW